MSSSNSTLVNGASCLCVGYPSDEELKANRVTREEVNENIRIIEIHRSFVYSLGKTIYPEYNFMSHDLSKFDKAEIIPYTIKFIQKRPDEENPGWTAALEHHLKNNPHHPQCWTGDMPKEFLLESIVDMVAARYQYRELKEVLPTHLKVEMFQLQPQYLERYAPADRMKVEAELERLQKLDWSKITVVCQFFQK